MAVYPRRRIRRASFLRFLASLEKRNTGFPSRKIVANFVNGRIFDRGKLLAGRMDSRSRLRTLRVRKLWAIVGFDVHSRIANYSARIFSRTILCLFSKPLKNLEERDNRGLWDDWKMEYFQKKVNLRTRRIESKFIGTIGIARWRERIIQSDGNRGQTVGTRSNY